MPNKNQTVVKINKITLERIRKFAKEFQTSVPKMLDLMTNSHNELLEACKQAYEDLEPFEYTDMMRDGESYAVMDTVEKLRAAIKKAEEE